MSGHVPKALRERVAEQARHRCGYCLTQERVIGAPMEIDNRPGDGAGAEPQPRSPGASPAVVGGGGLASSEGGDGGPIFVRGLPAVEAAARLKAASCQSPATLERPRRQ